MKKHLKEHCGHCHEVITAGQEPEEDLELVEGETELEALKHWDCPICGGALKKVGQRNGIVHLKCPHDSSEFSLDLTVDEDKHYLEVWNLMESYEEINGKIYWGKAGAGVIFRAGDTGRFLFALRSEDVEQPGTWGVWGGKVDPGENAEQAALREAEEEADAHNIIGLDHLYTFKDGSFRYDTFIADTPREFAPRLNWETDDYRWVSLDELGQLRPLHFGVKALLPSLKEKFAHLQEDKSSRYDQNYAYIYADDSPPEDYSPAEKRTERFDSGETCPWCDYEFKAGEDTKRCPDCKTILERKRKHKKSSRADRVAYYPWFMGGHDHYDHYDHDSYDGDFGGGDAGGDGGGE